MKQIDNNKIVLIALILNLLIFINSYYISFSKPFWYDEIHMVFLSSNIFNITINEYFVENGLHFPLYVILTGLIDLISNNPNDLRLINLIGIIPFCLSLYFLKSRFNKINIIFCIFLSTSSYVFYFFSTELKMYFLLFCFSFLLHSIYIIDSEHRSLKTNIIYYLTCIIISLLHIFGMAIALCVLFCDIIIFLSKKKIYKIFETAFISLIIFCIFLFMLYKSISVNEGSFDEIGYIKFQKWYFRAFMEWIIPALMFNLFFCSIILVKVGIKQFIYFPSNDDLYLKKFKLIIPSIILVVITSLISLKIPIITHRNLIVTFPPVIIFASILYQYFNNNHKLNYFIIIICLFSIFINIKSYRSQSIKPGENIKWVIEKSFSKECEGIPIYLNDNINKDHWEKYLNHSLYLYSQFDRPIKKLSEFNFNDLNYILSNLGKCKVIAASFHERNFETKVENTLNKHIKNEILIAPNVLISHSKAGAIVILKN